MGCQSDDTPNNDSEVPTQVNYVPLLRYDMENSAVGNSFLNWTKSVHDNSKSFSGEQSIKISTNPGGVLPDCSGSHRFAGRTLIDENLRVPPGKLFGFESCTTYPVPLVLVTNMEAKATVQPQRPADKTKMVIIA